MNAAVYYLGRFEATQARLERVLQQKVRRWSLQQDISEHQAMIEETVAKCVRLELVDDARFGALRKAQLLRKGKGARLISQDLQHKGLEAPLTQDLVGQIEDADERKAAAALAKRRRLGPFRGPRERSAFDADPKKQRDKEIAVFARAGHRYETASAVLACSSEDALNQWLESTD